MKYLVFLLCLLSCFGNLRADADDDVVFNSVESAEYNLYYDIVVRRPNVTKSTIRGMTWYEEPQDKVVVKHFTQFLDHEPASTHYTWNMRIFQNSIFWEPNGTIYIYIGGNYPLDESCVTEGLMYDLAKEMKGVMFGAEHRYYGEDKQLSNLTYLSVSQAIQDIRYLVANIKYDENYQHSKVVLIGAGYGGSIAVWTKHTFPRVCHTVIASGAPLLAQIDFKEYYKRVISFYDERMPCPCMKLVRDRFSFYKSLFDNKDIDGLGLYARMCKKMDISNERNQQLFFQTELHKLAAISEEGLIPMYRLCKGLQDANLTAVGDDLFWDNKRQCYDYDFKKFINKFKFDQKLTYTKRWLWQCCTELGFFQTTKLLQKPFDLNITVQYYTELCTAVFGSEYNLEFLEDQVIRFNARNGGHAPRVTNALFVHGQYDPWNPVAAVDANILRRNATALLKVPHASHCREMFPKNLNVSDYKELVNAKKEVKEFLQRSLSLPDNLQRQLLNDIPCR